MEDVKGSTRKKLIGSFYVKNWQHGKLFTVKYFQEMGVPPKLRTGLLRSVTGRPKQRKPGSGRPAQKMNQNKVRALIRYLEGKVGVSQRKAAKKICVSQSYVAKIVREKSSIRYFRRQPVPAATEQQKEKQKQRCSELRRHLFKPRGKTLIIMDDESYFRLKGDQMGANRGYYTEDKENTNPNVKYRTVDKFPKKVMLWVAISEKGVSQPYFIQKNSLNGKIYREQCIPRLKKFINEKHKQCEVVHWPDLAPAFYDKSVLEELKKQKIPIVPKKSNPPAVPQIRPIEEFFGTLKDMVYADGWEAADIKQLVARIRSKIRAFPVDRCQNLFRGLKTKVRKVADGGHAALLQV